MVRYKESISRATEEHEVDENEVNEDGSAASKKGLEIKSQGLSLYLSMHSLIYVGFFRLLPSLDFRAEILFGYSLELILSLFPMILIQMFNNSDVPGKLTGIQSASLTFKFLALLNMIPELIMMIWELKLNNDFKKLNYKAY